MKRLVWITIAIALVGCAKTAPQRPSQRSGQPPRVDSTVLGMIEVNERLAEEADKEVAQWIANHPAAHFHQMECGAWRLQRDEATSLRAQTAPTPQPKEKWTIHYQVRHLDNTLAEDIEGTYTIARGELPAAIDEAVQQMIADETTTLIAPWYSAFGMKGTDHIKPYENVIITITL